MRHNSNSINSKKRQKDKKFTLDASYQSVEQLWDTLATLTQEVVSDNNAISDYPIESRKKQINSIKEIARVLELSHNEMIKINNADENLSIKLSPLTLFDFGNENLNTFFKKTNDKEYFMLKTLATGTKTVLPNGYYIQGMKHFRQPDLSKFYIKIGNINKDKDNELSLNGSFRTLFDFNENGLDLAFKAIKKQET